MRPTTKIARDLWSRELLLKPASSFTQNLLTQKITRNRRVCPQKGSLPRAAAPSPPPPANIPATAVRSSILRLAGFTDPTSSPQPGSAEEKSGGRAWQLFTGWGLAKTMMTTTLAPAPAAETTAPKGGNGSQSGGGEWATKTTTPQRPRRRSGSGGCHDNRERARG